MKKGVISGILFGVLMGIILGMITIVMFGNVLKLDILIKLGIIIAGVSTIIFSVVGISSFNNKGKRKKENKK